MSYTFMLMQKCSSSAIDHSNYAQRHDHCLQTRPCYSTPAQVESRHTSRSVALLLGVNRLGKSLYSSHHSPNRDTRFSVPTPDRHIPRNGTIAACRHPMYASNDRYSCRHSHISESAFRENAHMPPRLSVNQILYKDKYHMLDLVALLFLKLIRTHIAYTRTQKSADFAIAHLRTRAFELARPVK